MLYVIFRLQGPTKLFLNRNRWKAHQYNGSTYCGPAAVRRAMRSAFTAHTEVLDLYYEPFSQDRHPHTPAQRVAREEFESVTP
jgi:hypothetical protein